MASSRYSSINHEYDPYQPRVLTPFLQHFDFYILVCYIGVILSLSEILVVFSARELKHLFLLSSSCCCRFRSFNNHFLASIGSDIQISGLTCANLLTIAVLERLRVFDSSSESDEELIKSPKYIFRMNEAALRRKIQHNKNKVKLKNQTT
jgi:hypothetical protein